jgi:hypothetical protein
MSWSKITCVSEELCAVIMVNKQPTSISESSAKSCE